MTQTQTRENGATPSGSQRAEQIASVAGAQLGVWVALNTRRLRQAAQVLGEEVKRPVTAASVTSRGSTAPPPSSDGRQPPTLERAEAVVEQLGQWSAEAGVQLQKTLARLWEDTEDMYMEAQDMRARWNDHRTTGV